MALGSTQPLREIGTRYISWRPVRSARGIYRDFFTKYNIVIYCLVLLNFSVINSLEFGRPALDVFHQVDIFSL